MTRESSTRSARRLGAIAPAGAIAASALAALALAPAAGAELSQRPLAPGSIVISGSTYSLPSSSVNPGVTVLPTGGVTAVADGGFPEVFNNGSVDGSFAVNTPIDLWDVGTAGQSLTHFQVPTTQATTSFSSKSELAINVSTNGQDLSMLGYDAGVGDLDVSNSNTPGVFDSTNPDPGSYYRVAATLGSNGRWSFTDTNAYSGDNGRTTELNDTTNEYYAAGNSNNGTGTPANVIASPGAQVFPLSLAPQIDQTPGAPTQLASFNVTSLGDKADKAGKDNNFRGLTVFDHVVYFTKGSGSNGVDTVYFVDTTNSACPHGVGLPVPGAPMPTVGGVPYTLCILNGFNTAIAKNTTNIFPFGMWFANKDTLYVADEGDGINTYDPTSNTYTDAAGETLAGLQKWVFSGGQWNLAYTIQNGLNLGQPYTVAGYPTGDNAANGLPWAPATDGLRNLSGHVNGDGTVTIYAVTSTVSGGGDQGADPNAVVAVTDQLGATTPGTEQFWTLKAPADGQIYRGVAVLPNGWGS